MIDRAKIIRYAVIGAFAFLILCLAIYFFTHKFFTLRIDNPDHIANMSYNVSDSNNKAATNLFGLYAVASDQPLLKISLKSGEETLLPIQRLPIVNPNTPVTIRKTKQADAYSSKSLGCNTYDQAHDSIVTYHCATAADALYSLDTSTVTPWQNKQLRPLALGLNYYNYLNGVITLTASDASERVALIYTPDGGLSHYKLDDSASRNINVDLATDMTDRTNTSFVVFSPQSGDVAYYAVDAQGQASPREYHYSTKNHTTATLSSRCALTGQMVYCLRGNLDSPGGHNEDPVVAPEITEIDFSKPTPKTTTYTLATDLKYVNAIFVDQQHRIYVKNNTDLYSVTAKSLQLIYPKTTGIASGQSLVFTTDTGIYRISSTGQIIKAFAGDHLQMSNLSSYGDTLLFDVFSQNDTYITNGITLKLSDAPATDTPSVLSLLPLSDKNLPLTSVTIAHGKIQLQPESFYISDRAAGTFHYDQQEYANSVAKIQNYLNDLKRQEKLPTDLEIVYAQ